MNKSILITGSSQRIGKELSLYFAKMGWNIAIHFNKSKKQANILKREIERYGVKCICIQGNLLNVKTIKKIIATANKKLGNINCIINNASIFNNDDILNFNEKSWNDHIKINLLAPAIFIKEFSKIKNLSENKSIINILDQRIFKLTPYFFSYTISKTGLHTITKTAAMKLALMRLLPAPSLKTKGKLKNILANNQKIPCLVRLLKLKTYAKLHIYWQIAKQLLVKSLP
jgi:NAD(P)-dependent dehydrogenase (short-subunit alcohol dehydrogenase family)